MLLWLLITALATMTFAEGEFKTLSQNTCDILRRWTFATNVNSSLNYVLQGKANTISLASNCESRLESAISSCLIDSKEECTALALSWDLFGPHVPEPIMKFRRSPVGQGNVGCSCMAQYSSTTNNIVSTTPTVIETLISAQPSDTSSSEAITTNSVRTCISSMRTITSAAQSLQSPTATTLPSSESEVVCIIKLEDLNSSPPGECYCFDGTTREWKTGECEVYS